MRRIYTCHHYRHRHNIRHIKNRQNFQKSLLNHQTLKVLVKAKTKNKTNLCFLFYFSSLLFNKQTYMRDRARE